MKRIVIKVGSHLITLGKEQFISSLVAQIHELKKLGCEVILVSSGAIASGIMEYDINFRPSNVVEKQVLASIGQPLLMFRYIEKFKKYGYKVAQILLTREDFDNRQRYLNVRNTLRKLLDWGVIPIINENDTVATEEIKLGDNDTLSAIVACKLNADLLIILTDVDGVYDKDPNQYPDAKIIPEVTDFNWIKKFCMTKYIAKSTFFCGTGGMKTKLVAAQMCWLSGVELVIANGLRPAVILDIYNGKNVGTRFSPKGKVITSRKQWIAFGKKIAGKIVIDSGAVKAITLMNKSLLPSGVKTVEGNFSAGDVVSLCDETGQEIARGITNFSSSMLEKIKNKKTSEIKKIFPEITVEEVVHKDNLVVL